MKSIVKILSLCLVVVCISLTSCGGANEKVLKEVNEKIENNNYSDFTDEEYEAMAQFVYDNAAEADKYDIEDLDKVNEKFPHIVDYMFILAFANETGELKGKAKELYKKIDKEYGD